MEQLHTNENGSNPTESERNPDGTFREGNSGGPGRPPMTEEERILARVQRDIIKEYKETLKEALPLISPILIAKAMEGDMPAIKEINDRVMGKSKETVEHQGGLAIQFASVFNKDANSSQ